MTIRLDEDVKARDKLADPAQCSKSLLADEAVQTFIGVKK